ncbi:MAG: DUF721 domain-containing protein [Treponema sp.]|jgi:hypothetical protein|nr:DUF721 domain-containing protein [Treponema sp.]
MRKIGDMLSLIIDEKMIHKAQGYSKLFASWAWLTKKYGIAAAADHSRIREMDRNVLLVEADHPGWIQILQTKEHKLLADLQGQFPDLGIAGISFRLSRTPPQPEVSPEEEHESADKGVSEEIPAAAPFSEETVSRGKKTAYEKIKDKELRETLKSLERSVMAGKKRHEKNERR